MRPRAPRTRTLKLCNNGGSRFDTSEQAAKRAQLGRVKHSVGRSTAVFDDQTIVAEIRRVARSLLVANS